MSRPYFEKALAEEVTAFVRDELTEKFLEVGDQRIHDANDVWSAPLTGLKQQHDHVPTVLVKEELGQVGFQLFEHRNLLFIIQFLDVSLQLSGEGLVHGLFDQ